MLRLEVRVELPEGEVLDASEQIRRLIESDGELCPPLRELLLSLDDAITEALAAAPRTEAMRVEG